jgi:hypothetical protein
MSRREEDFIREENYRSGPIAFPAIPKIISNLKSEISNDETFSLRPPQCNLCVVKDAKIFLPSPPTRTNYR